MHFKIYRYVNRLILHSQEGGWGEVCPLASRNRETLPQCLDQLQAVQSGWKGPLYPSVAFALESASHPFKAISWPVATLFMGSEKEILQQAEKSHEFSHAKLKIGNLTVQQAIKIATELKKQFRLRLDFNRKWKPEDVLTFCRHFEPTDFEFLEDPGVHIDKFALASDEDALGEIKVWKPSVKGIPLFYNNLILSSAWESGIGIASIIALAERLKLPHPPGIGTYFHMKDDVLEESLSFSKGKIYLYASSQLFHRDAAAFKN
jgi:O-succinylbenzoate synthase